MSGNNAHSEYPPSALKRLMNCPASKALCDSLPKVPPSVYALQGSGAHLVGSRCLEIELDATDMIGRSVEHVETRVWTKEDIPLYKNAGLPLPNYAIGEVYTLAAWYGKLDEDMALAVQTYLNYVRGLRNLLKNCIQGIEKQYDLSWIMPGMFGTADSTLLVPFDVLYVTDYKHGAGVAVDIENNEQLMAYGLGALGKNNPYQVQKVVLTIVQPRAIHSDGPIRTWDISAKDLIEWGEYTLRPALQRTLLLNPEYKAGDWCKWCAGKPKCPELINQMFSNSLVPSDKPVLPAIGDLTSEEMDRYLNFTEVLNVWIKAVRDEAYKRLELALPNAPKQFKLVKGKGSRSWHNEELTATYCEKQIGEDAFTTRTLKSPAQMEKMFQLTNLNSKDLSLFIKKIEGKPSMVSTEDSRKSLPSKIDQMFPEGE